MVKREGSHEGEGGAGEWVEGDGTRDCLVRIGLTEMGKANSVRGRISFLGEVWTRLWMVKRVPGSLPDTYNLIPQVLPVFQEQSWF